MRFPLYKTLVELSSTTIFACERTFENPIFKTKTLRRGKVEFCLKTAMVSAIYVEYELL